MGFLNKWFRSGQAQAGRIDRLKTKLDSFMRPSVALVDSRDMTIPDRRRRYVYFVYGAIHALGEDQELDDTERLAILVGFLETTARMHAREVSKLVAHCTNQQADGQTVLTEGYQAMQQWLAGDAGTAVSRLGRVLKD